MKNLIFILSFVFLVSCGGKAPQVTEAPPENTTNQAHNSKNSLDYMGTYKGTLPMASKGGMGVTIVLADSTYTKTTQLPDNSKPEEVKGTYAWNAEGNTITLVGISAPNQYTVGEGTLTQLDMEGKKIESENPEHYILKKQ